MDQNPKTWKALIVDDEIHNLGVVRYVLNFHGAETQLASSGQEALIMLEYYKPTFVLLDLQMPEMSGYDVLKIIRQDAKIQHLPIIALTSFAMQEDYNRGMAAGFDGYITKPINVAIFINQVSEVLANKERL